MVVSQMLIMVFRGQPVFFTDPSSFPSYSHFTCIPSISNHQWYSHVLLALESIGQVRTVTGVV